MSQLLKNKWIVGCLVLSALVSIGGKFNVFSAASLTPQSIVSKGVAKVLATPEIQQQLPYGSHLVDWPETTSRDPFAFTAAYEEAATLLPTRPTPNKELPDAKTILGMAVFDLQGVSMVSDNPMAVINRTIVAEGESIEGYHVVQILADRVVLEGLLGTKVIEFADPRADEEDNDEENNDD